jgi:cold shock CspA family protein
MKPGLHRGQLTTWKDERGFGFIRSVSGSQEIFIHISELKDSTRRQRVGDTIYYHTMVKDKKIRACNAFILGARKKPNSSYALSNKAVNNNYPFPILEVLLLSLLPLIGSLHFAWIATNPIPLILYPNNEPTDFWLIF